MAEYFRVSPPSVHQMILTLEAKGFIVRRPGRARSVRVLVDPIDPRPTCGEHTDADIIPADVERSPTVEVVRSVFGEVLRRQFAHLKRYPMDDSEFVPLIGSMLDGVEAGLRLVGATKRFSARARERLLEEALTIYSTLCARNDPEGADEEEDRSTFLFLMENGEWPGAR